MLDGTPEYVQFFILFFFLLITFFSGAAFNFMTINRFSKFSWNHNDKISQSMNRNPWKFFFLSFLSFFFK